MGNSELKLLARNQLKGRWKEAVLIHLVYIAFIIVPNITPYFNNPDYYSTGELIFDLVTFIFYGPVLLGFAYFCLNFIKYKGNINDLLLKPNKFVKAIITDLLITIAFAIGFILLVVPGVIISIMFSQAYFIIVENDDISPIKAIKESVRLMKGNKARFFKLNLSFIGWGILGLVTLGIGLLWIIPYYNITLANFYKDITWPEQ